MNSRLVGPIVALIFFVVLWESVRLYFRLPNVLLPSIIEVGAASLEEPRFLTHFGTTLGEALTGFIVGNFVAMAMAILILRWQCLEVSLMPYAIALKTTPVVAVAPILILWFGGGWESKAATAAMVCFFPTLINLVRGLRVVDAPEYTEYRDLFASWGIGWWKTLLHLRGPFALPMLFSALKVSSSLALVGAIIGEFIAADKGLGYLMVIYSRRLETASMFAALLAATTLGVLWFFAIAMVEIRLSRRFGTLTAKGDWL